MKPDFTAEFFKQNRERLRTLFTGTAPIVITANGMMQRSGDTTFSFRQDSNFWYLTGINEPDIVLVLDKNKEYLIVPEREEWRKLFEGNVEHDSLVKISGITEVLNEKIGWKQLASRLKKVQHAATLSSAPAYIESHGFYTNPARAHLISHIKEIAGDNLELLDLRPHLTRMRAVKQEVELDSIQAAIDATIEAVKNVERRRNKYKFEYEIEAEITSSFISKGLNHAYPPIIASGKRACTIHSFENDAPLEAGSLLLLDVGAELNNYSADISRTYALGEPTKRQQSVFDTVLEVHNYASGLIKPGVIYKEYENQVSQFMGEKLRELGLIKLIEKEQVRKYFPHLTSHYLGLDTHDVYDSDRPFEPGMVLTVEPAIYIPEEGIGIRIEDDVVITSDGIKNMSEKLPAALQA